MRLRLNFKVELSWNAQPNGGPIQAFWSDKIFCRVISNKDEISRIQFPCIHHSQISARVRFPERTAPGISKNDWIKELVETLNSFLDFNYKFDTTKPSGYPKRVMDITLARKLVHYKPTTSLSEGLKKTWKWFVKNSDEYLKKKNYFKGGS